VNVRSAARTLIALALLTLATPTDARADWMFTPFVGTAFGTETSFVLLETGATNTAQLIFGGSAAFLSRGILGVEADFSYAPRFFERDNRAGNITSSNIYTLSGNVIVAVPLSLTRESLRPYGIGGLGLIHATVDDAFFNLLDVSENMLGYNVGGGAIGLISPRAGFRFEIRHFRTVDNADNLLTGENSPKLSFWRATVGVVIRVAN
jgi:opacity protein-like surface antigen